MMESTQESNSTGLENPLGLDGIEFVEFAAPNIEQLEQNVF